MSAAAQDDGRDRVAVVLGGAHGIGEACCRLLRERGWRVVVADIDLGAADALAREISAHALRVDVLDAASIRSLAEQVEARIGAPYAMVNSAAIFAPQQAPETLPLDVWDRIVESAYRGTYVSNVAFAARMATHGAGSIVNISSMVGQRPNHGHAYYSAKAAVNALTEGMAGEWGRSGVRVNAVSPGFVAVPRMVANIQEGRRYAHLAGRGQRPRPPGRTRRGRRVDRLPAVRPCLGHHRCQPARRCRRAGRPTAGRCTAVCRPRRARVETQP